jgi:flagellar motor switch protein FliG
MSQRAADLFREDFESRGPVRVADVEAEQKRVLQVVKRLADSGVINLGGKADEAYV